MSAAAQRSGATPGTVVISAEDEFLRAREREGLLSAVRANSGEVTVTEVSGEALTVAEMHQGLTPDLFGGVPVLVVTDAKKASQPVLRAVLDWCASGSSDAVLVLEWVRAGAATTRKPEPKAAGAVASRGAPRAASSGSSRPVALADLVQAGVHLVEVTAPKGVERRRFAAEELRAVGLSADGAAEALLAEGEADLRGIAMRARQLASDLDASSGRVRLSAEQVAQVASSPAATGGFAVADALVARNARALAAAVSAAQESGTANVLIVSACLSGLRNVAAVHSGTTGKMPPWKVAQAQRAARGWTAAALARAVAEVGGAHPAVGSSGRRDSDLVAALLRAAGA